MRVRADRYRQRAADAKDRAGQAPEGRTTVALTAQAVNDCRQEPVHDLRPKDSLSSLGRPLARRSRLNPENRDGGDPAHPGAHAVWPVRAERSERNLWPAHVFPKWSPSIVAPKPVHEGSRDPAPLGIRAGFRFGESHAAARRGMRFLANSGTRLIVRALREKAAAARQNRFMDASFTRSSASLKNT